MEQISRRTFASAAAFTIVPRHVLGAGMQAPSDRLNIAAVGIGGMGKNYVDGCKSQNIVALADVDDKLAAPVRKLYPRAKEYRDYRVMLEKEKGIDAVIIGTPDHSHAMIAMAAIGLRKGVYVAKPMTRTLHECRALVEAARAARVATQMSVQSCSSDASVTAEEWIKAGVIGPVREVHVWSDRPVWPQALARPAETPPVPAHLDWDLWLGPAPERAYHPVYHPFNFRGWYDFGTGGLGDMACHAFHTVVKALELGAPLSVESSVTVVREALRTGEKGDENWTRSRRARNYETFPASSITTWEFPARGRHPAARLVWYDGGLRPPRPAGMAPEKNLGADGVLYVGEKGVLHTGFTGGPRFLSAEQERSITPPAKSLPRSQGHYLEWIAACKGGRPANCNFDFAGPVTEIALLGAIAQRTGRYLRWDPANLRITNDEVANAYVAPAYRQGWSL
jgi:predicted dehydrogenase